MPERGPLRSANARRRNKRPARGATVMTTGKPARPIHLAGEARKEWDRVVPALDLTGLLAPVDRAVLIRYCTAWAEWVELEQAIRQTGKLIEGRGGTVVRNPMWLLRRDAAQELDTLMRALGLTPSARLRMEIAHAAANPAPPTQDGKPTAIDQYRKGLKAQ